MRLVFLGSKSPYASKPARLTGFISAVRNDRVQVITDRDEHRGDIYNRFYVVKHGGKWHIEES
jgi:hypothetical protein